MKNSVSLSVPSHVRFVPLVLGVVKEAAELEKLDEKKREELIKAVGRCNYVNYPLTLTIGPAEGKPLKSVNERVEKAHLLNGNPYPQNPCPDTLTSFSHN